MAALPAQMNSREVAELVGVELSTVKSWRAQGTGPTFHRLDTGGVVYRRAAVKRWIGDNLPDHAGAPWMTTAEVAEAAGVRPRTVQSWRGRGLGPAFVTLGPYIAYPRTAVTQWLREGRDT